MDVVFDQIRNLDLTIFAVVMEKPTKEIAKDSMFLPPQYRYIMQRVNALLAGENSLAFVLIDGDGSHNGGLSTKIERYLNRSNEGQSMTKLVDTPYFVDSRLTIGIQLADLVAGAIRIYQEAGLFRNPPTADIFHTSVARYYRIIESKTKDLYSPEGYLLHGMYFMPERLHYFDSEDGSANVEGTRIA